MHSSLGPGSAQWVPLHAYETKCGFQDSTAGLLTVPRAHFTTRQAGEVPIYHPSTSNTQQLECQNQPLLLPGIA